MFKKYSLISLLGIFLTSSLMAAEPYGSHASAKWQIWAYTTAAPDFIGNFATVNEVMTQFVKQPYPARAAMGVRALPKGVQVEIEGIMVLED